MIQALENRCMMSVTVDLRVPGGGKTISTTSLAVGTAIRLQVWAVVKGVNTLNTDEGFQSIFGSFTSGNVSGGSVKGSLRARLRGTFSGNSSSAGKARDLDADGDLDLGSKSNSDVAGYFSARSPVLQKTGRAINGGQEFYIADLYFTPQELLFNNRGYTRLNFVPRSPSTIQGVWKIDGWPLLGTDGVSAARPVLITGPAAAPAHAAVRVAPLGVTSSMRLPERFDSFSQSRIDDAGSIADDQAYGRS